ncbi:MAG TPA: DNA replication and repair protein RecF [Polyangiaceae bacterium]|nr:DNA replication and repair protein RecF [Polyangiaceae bacterium]
MSEGPSASVAKGPEPVRLTLGTLDITNLRNLERVRLEAAGGVNVITGNNGHGKTSVLESIYVLATSRSFRTPRLGEMVRHGERIGSVRGTFVEHLPTGTVSREQSVGLTGGRRTVRLDGEPPSTLSHYATRSPVVVFDPQQMTLSTGPAVERRTLLDRVTLFTRPDVAGHRSRYAKALKERQRLLADRFPRIVESPELDAYEVILAEHGSAMTRARAAASERLGQALIRAFSRIASPELVLESAYEPGGSMDAEEAQRALRDGRAGDARRRRTGFGPHRDDITLTIGGHPARIVASQGQHRAITLAMKIAELDIIGRARGVLPILLLDDVSSELDADRTAALFAHLATTESQIFLTTTRRDLILTPRGGLERRDWLVTDGAVTAV